MDELTTFEGQVAARAFRHSAGRVPRRVEEEHRRLEALAAARRRWRELRSELHHRRTHRATRHAA